MKKKLRININEIFSCPRVLNKKHSKFFIELSKLDIEDYQVVEFVIPKNVKVTEDFIESMLSVSNVSAYQSYDNSVVLSIYYPGGIPSIPFQRLKKRRKKQW